MAAETVNSAMIKIKYSCDKRFLGFEIGPGLSTHCTQRRAKHTYNGQKVLDNSLIYVQK